MFLEPGTQPLSSLLPHTKLLRILFRWQCSFTNKRDFVGLDFEKFSHWIHNLEKSEAPIPEFDSTMAYGSQPDEFWRLLATAVIQVTIEVLSFEMVAFNSTFFHF